jgi:hypothetical protein
MASQNNNATTSFPSGTIEPRNVDEVTPQRDQDQSRFKLVCTLLGLNPETEQRALETILDDFEAMPKASKATFVLGLAVDRLSSMETPTSDVQPQVARLVLRRLTDSPSSLGTVIRILMNFLWNFGLTSWRSTFPTSVVPR